eukprot:s2461_g2.t1
MAQASSETVKQHSGRRILVQADRKKTADTMLDTAPAPAKTNVEGPAEGWADVEPARKKEKLGGLRVKWVRELAFVQKGPEDKTAYCGHTQMGVDMTEKVHCFRGCKGECENRWECPCPCHVLQRAYDESLAETARAKMRKEQSEDAK